MKIALLGYSQLSLSVAWGICQSELAQKIVFFTDAQSNSKQRNRSTTNRRPITDDVEDITLATAMSASDTAVSFTNAGEDLSDSDVVVLLPASLPFGFHSAQALKTTNLSIARQIVAKVQEHIQNAKILVAMPFANYISAWIHQTHGINNVIGIANGVSTAHLKSEIANSLGLSVKDVSALAIGNDEVTYPLPQYCRVNGIPLTQLMGESDIQNLSAAVADRCPYTSASEYTLASHILQVVSAISLDKKRVMSLGTSISTDTTSVFLNVPSKIGSDGIESIIPLDLTDPQREQFKQLVAQSAAAQSFS
jgi:malate dehydrogenase